MNASTKLSIVLAFPMAKGAPKVLYLGYDADEAKSTLKKAAEKGGYSLLKVCRGFDAYFIDIWRAEPVAA
jgi:hypothetical protein